MTSFRDVLAQLSAADLTHIAPRLVDPSTLKDAFIVEDLAATTDSSNTPPPAEDHWTEYLYDCVLVTIICCWWMLRGIEVAAARFSHVWFETTAFGRLAFFTLPCHKTDTVGMCVTRSHPCTCSDNMAALCPYHALDTFIRRNHRPGTDRSDEYLFYGRRGGPITHLETIEAEGHLQYRRRAHQTRSPGTAPTSIQRTCVQGLRIPVLDTTRLPPGDGSTYWSLGQ